MRLLIRRLFTRISRTLVIRRAGTWPPARFPYASPAATEGAEYVVAADGGFRDLAAENRQFPAEGGGPKRVRGFHVQDVLAHPWNLLFPSPRTGVTPFIA